MTDIADIRWGSYQTREGPYYLGRERYSLPPNPTRAERIMAVITATEGGCYDAVNMYDRCIVSVGLIQWCEADMCGVSNMFTALLPKHRSLLDPLLDILGERGVADFAISPGGSGRLLTRDGEWVTTAKQQQDVWLGGVSGKQGEWTAEARLYAKRVAAAVADLAAREVAKHYQIEFTTSRLGMFVLPKARDILFSEDAYPPIEFLEPLQAAYLSFAVNNPTWAQKSLLHAMQALPKPWSIATVIHILRSLTFYPNVAIYPDRYYKIRPVLERLYGIDLPDFAAELKAFDHSFYPSTPGFYTTEDVQQELLAQGFDLGPRGADGVMGNKTLAAIKAFQKTRNLKSDGVIGPQTRSALIQAYLARIGA